MDRPGRKSRVTAWLEAAPPSVLAAYAIACSFAAYFSMYAFRKPFAAASYEGVTFLGSTVDLKAVLIISQIVGYAAAKWLGIKICSEVTRQRRAPMLIGMILTAEATLALFAVLPKDMKILALFLNGLSLGMVWGLVVWYLEGRRSSEILLAGLSCSFIVSSAAVKDVGNAVLEGKSIPLLGFAFPNPFSPMVDHPYWMPVIVGGLFLFPFAAAVILLDQLPEPTARDVIERSERHTMDSRDRHAFLRRFLPGLAMLLAVYVFATAFRDFRDNYTVELLAELKSHATIARSETYVMFGVICAMGMLYFIRDNVRALMAVFAVVGVGLALLSLANILHQAKVIDGFSWMVLVGLGIYLAYVPYGSVMFDRLIASTHVAGTAVFAIYVADSLGYVGSIAVNVHKEFFAKDSSKLHFLQAFAYALSWGGVVLIAMSAAYFYRQSRTAAPAHTG